MIIKKVLNNNSAIVEDENKEFVVLGSGITFQKKKGDMIQKKKVNKIFVRDKENTQSKLIKLLEEIPPEYFEISEMIISVAEKKLEVRLNDNLYLSLTDHISFAVSNFTQQVHIRNSLLWDIKRLYKREFEVALLALDIIYERTNIRLPEDEAASITLHLINGQINKEIPEIVGIMTIIQEVLSIIKYTLSLDFDEDSLDYYRLVSHLKFFAERVLTKSYYELSDSDFYLHISSKYPEAFECSKKIAEYIQRTYHSEINDEELLYLTIHISRIYQK